MTLLPEKRVKAERKKLKNLVERHQVFSTKKPSDELEAVCLPIAIAYLERAIYTQMAYLKRWKVEVDDETLHRWRQLPG